MANQWRAKIATDLTVGLIVAGVILAVAAAWSPGFHYFAHHGYQWRIWVAVVACVLVVAGLCLVAARRRSQRRAEAFFWELTGAAEAARQDAPASRDWAALAAALPGIAALVALIFTALSVQQSQGQLKATQQQLVITEKGQVTDRYNAAVTNLGSNSIDMRLGGIYALQRLMQDSPPDQPTIVAVLCAFARDQSAMDAKPGGSSASPPTDVRAALTVVGTRAPGKADHGTLIDLDHALLPGAALEFLSLAYGNLIDADLAGANLNGSRLGAAKLTGADLAGANLSATDLDNANLADADLAMVDPTSTDLRNANLTGANLTGAVMASANLTGASFYGADLTGAVLAGESLTGLSFGDANLTGADFSGADLTQGYLVAAELADAKFINANLSQADLTGADLPGADIRYVNLTGADLSGANLTKVTGYAANLSGANLTGADLAHASFNGTAADFAGANLTDADLTGTTFTGANLTGAYWPRGATVPAGWQRKPSTGQLERAGH